jgi:fatty-acyl-CoA synthase
MKHNKIDARRNRMPGGPNLESTMMDDFPLNLRMLFRHGRRIHGASQIITWTGAEPRRVSFEETAQRAARLASALAALGVDWGERIGTFMWNNQEHMEAYFAVPCMGTVLHTLNIRLFPEQLVYVVNHGQDKVIIVDDTLAPLIARVADQLTSVEHFLVTGSGGQSQGLDAGGAAVHAYDALLDAAEPEYSWPDLPERTVCALCYTTGTTGRPKGVAYSHRSTVLHALGSAANAVEPLTDNDRALIVVPQFHAMAWGLPYWCWMRGADLLMPAQFLKAEPLAEMIASEKPTFAAAVPTIWNDLLHYTETHPSNLSSINFVNCGGAAVPRNLIDRFKAEHGVPIIQGWGMTETSPAAAIAWPPRGVGEDEANDWRAKTGRVLVGVELRVVAENGAELPWDGKSVGEFEVRGPWVTARYFGDDAPEKFHDGWLCTGDVGFVEPLGFMRITDRAKDIIKSGGEWISSVELENELMAHPDVAEAAVVGVPDERWDERPLACVVRRENTAVQPESLREFLTDKVARWWLPERWSFVDEIPKTSVGKFDKRTLRARYGDGELEVITLIDKAKTA